MGYLLVRLFWIESRLRDSFLTVVFCLRTFNQPLALLVKIYDIFRKDLLVQFESKPYPWLQKHFSQKRKFREFTG